jgi:hypothetical protein
MTQIVKCDICGGLYSESHLSSHKRLSHGKRKRSLRSFKNQPASLELILSLYEGLSEDQKKELRERLAAFEQPKP